MKKNPLRNREVEDLLLYSFRYALGLKTHTVSDVSLYIIKCSAILTTPTRQKIISEIVKAVSTGKAGEPCDVSDWENVLEVLIND